MTQIASSHSYLQPRFSGQIDVDKQRLDARGIPKYIIHELEVEASRLRPLENVTGYVTADRDMSGDDDRYIEVNITNDPEHPIRYDWKTGTSADPDTQKPRVCDYITLDPLARLIGKAHESVQYMRDLYQQYTGTKPNA